jgi:hypothetical protein
MLINSMKYMDNRSTKLKKKILLHNYSLQYPFEVRTYYKYYKMSSCVLLKEKKIYYIENIIYKYMLKFASIDMISKKS